MSKIKYVLKDKETGTFFMSDQFGKDIVTSFDISHAREYSHKTSAKKKAEFLKREFNLECDLITIENVPRVLVEEEVWILRFTQYKGESK